MAQSIFYVNGELVTSDRAALPLNDLGIVRGYGVFDYWRTYNYVHFHMDDHLRRLQRSAEQIDLALPCGLDELAAHIDMTYAANDYANAGIRVVVTGGASTDFMTPQGNPSLVIMVTPLPEYNERLYTEGVKTVTTEMVRERPTVKSINYIGAIVAVERAKQEGAVEAIYRTPDGYLTEGTRANFFIFKGNQLITPDVDVLPGITRQVVLQLAAIDFQVIERPIHMDELTQADEAFITSSTKELLPVVQVDEIAIGNGLPGEGTRSLLAAFRAYAWSLAEQRVAGD